MCIYLPIYAIENNYNSIYMLMKTKRKMDLD